MNKQLFPLHGENGDLEELKSSFQEGDATIEKIGDSFYLSLEIGSKRKHRERLPLPHAAIVGYTNVGKSSLLKKLTGAEVLIENKLFATLDTTTRRIDLPSEQGLLLTDTVGFVRNLPHRLIEAFKATLEEATLADFLVHVLDASHPHVYDFFETTMQVLAELGADSKRMITVFNKIDRVEDQATITACPPVRSIVLLSPSALSIRPRRYRVTEIAQRSN